MNLFTVLLFLHLFGAIVGIGPTFAFGRITSAGAGTEHSLFATRVVSSIIGRMAIPLAALVLLSGVGLILEVDYDIVATKWLLVSLVLFIGGFTYSITVQNRTLGRIITLGQGNGSVDVITAGELARLRSRARYGGIYLRVSATVILFLMVFKPF